jgi:hypothetical protein
MLLSPTHVALGASAIEPMARFFQRFGFARTEDRVLSAFAARELYGLKGATSEAVLVMPGADLGYLRLVETGSTGTRSPGGGAGHGPFDLGAHAVDLYVRDMDRAVAQARRAGARVGPIAPYRIGGMFVRECKCVGPDEIALVLIEVDKRRPSILDRHAAALFSEVHSAVYVVDQIAQSGPFWNQAGLQTLLDATFAEPGVAAFMGLPRPDTRLRLVLYADGKQMPVRLELIEFPDPDGRNQPAVDPLPLRPGRFAFGFEAKDAAVLSADFRARGASMSRQVSVDGRQVIAGTAPGGVRFELWAT